MIPTIAPALFQFDIKTGRLVGSFSPIDTVHNQMFGDLVLDSKGTPYVSDSRNNIIYTYDADRRELLPYFSSKEFWSIQGLCFSDDDNVLYIADYIKGIFMLEVKTMKLSKVIVPYDLSLKGTDGILFYKNSLITIQNGVQPNRVVRHFLSKAGNSFIGYEYIDNAHPAFGEPTIGCISQNTLFYVANSQWSAYENGKIKDPAELHPIVILKYVLKEYNNPSPKIGIKNALRAPLAFCLGIFLCDKKWTQFTLVNILSQRKGRRFSLRGRGRVLSRY
jgi:hypothetical protein